jgi:hypothetical protein
MKNPPILLEDFHKEIKQNYFLIAFLALSAAALIFAFAVSTTAFAVESTFFAAVSTIALTVSVAALAAESTLLAADSVLLLQAAMKPATAKRANSFFMSGNFKWKLLRAKVKCFSRYANLFC